ncbi:MAG: protein kinase, partial [Lentisphaerae bacterium]|nr:protein kinase [Lentisphaerota bacterium]
PNIVTAFDAGEDAGILYFAMALIQGESLEARIKREGYLPEQPALALTRKLASALAYAWNDHQLLHRDIKPSNVLLDKTGEPKLVDFGLAKSVSAQAGLTLSNVIMGTPNYMSPEQIEDSAKVDARADMYSLGATLYNMLTGQIPFAGSSVMDVIKKQMSEPLPDPREFNPDLSDGAVALLEILLLKDRGERHETWEAVMADLDRVLAGQAPLTTSPETGHSTLVRVRDQAALAELKRKRPRLKKARDEGGNLKPEAGIGDQGRKKLWLAGAGVAAVVLIGLGIWWAGHGSWSPAVPGATTVNTATVQQAKAPTTESAVVARALPPNRPGYDHALGVASGASSPANDAQARARQAYMQALEYKDAHPDDMKGILSRFETVKRDAAGTEYQAKAEEQIKRLEDVKKQGVDKAWLALKAEADKLAAAGKLQEAVDKLDGFDKLTAGQFNGAYAAELASSRETLASELKGRLASAAKVKEAEAEKERQAQAQKEAAAKKEEAQKLLSEMRRDMAAKLLNGDFPGAAALAQAAKKNSALAELSAEVTEDEQMLQKLARLPEILAESFAGDKGKEIAIEFKTGQSVTLQITGRDGRTVKARRMLPQGFAEQNFAVTDISANERLKRLAGNPTPEAAILRGLAAYEARNTALAVKEFRSLPTIAPSGVEGATVGVEGQGSSVEGRVGMALAEAVKEATARKDLAVLLKLAGFTGELLAPDKVDLGAKTWTATQAEKLKDATKEYQRLHGQTQTAKAYAGVLETLAAVKASSTNAPLPPNLPATPQPGGGGSGGLSDVATRAKSDLSGVAARAKPEVFEQIPMKEPTEENLKKALEELKADNPSVKELKETHKITADGIELNIANRSNESLDNIKALAGLPITVLNITGTKIKDLKPLYGMPLKQFTAACSQIEDIRPLTNSPIENMDVWGSPSIRDFSPLRNIKSLRILKLYQTSFCDKDFKHLKALPLTSLYISSCRIKNIEALRGMPLTYLNISSTLVEDLSPLADAPLSVLLLECAPIKDIKPLAGKRLTNISLMGTLVSDLSPLAGMPLETLSVGRSSIKSRIEFKPLAGMPLKVLNLYLGWEESPDADKLPEYLPDLEKLLLDFLKQPVKPPAFVLKFEYLKSVEILFSGKGTKMTPEEYRKKYFSKPEPKK